MTGLVRFAVNRWQLTLLFSALLIALGLAAFKAIPRTEDPQINFPDYFIAVVVPGASPVDLEQQVTKPIEDALAGTDGLREVVSTTSDGAVTITGKYNWNVDPERKFDEVVREVNALRPSLPPNIARMQIDRGRPTWVPFVQVALTSDILPMRAFDKLARRLRDQLARVPGVRKSEVFGAPTSTVQVGIDPARLAALGLSPAALVDALKAGGADAPIGSVNAGRQRYNVRYAGDFPDIAAVRALPVVSASGRIVRLGEVAQVDWVLAEPQHIVRFKGRRALLVTANPADGQDVSKLTRTVDAELERFKLQLPGSVKLERGFTQANNVRHRLDQLTRDFVLALLMVSITLLPLGWRAAGVVMLAIPVSLLIGVAMLAALGFTLNQLAIAGFVISLGLLVDDAIVVIENIARWLRDGAERSEAAVGATGQIGLAVLGCTFSLLFAFLPLMALPEASGQFVRSLPVAVLGTVAGSLVVALTLIPFAASRLLSRHEDPHGNRLLQAITRGIHRLYAPVLHRALNAPGRSLALIMGASALSLPLLAVIGSSLFPPAELPQFTVKVEMAQGSALAATDAMVARVEAVLRADPEVAWTAAHVGRGSPPLYYNAQSSPENPARGEVAASLKDWNPRRSPAVIDRLRQRLDAIPGAKLRLVIFNQGPPVEAPVAIRILGRDLGTLSRLALAAERELAAMPELRDVENPLRMQRTDLRLAVDEARAQALGVPAGALRQAVQLALNGVPAARLRDGDGDDYPVTVRLPQSSTGGQPRNEIAALGAIQVPIAGGGSVPLSTLARPSFSADAAQINRIQRERAVTVTAYVKDGVLVSRATEAALARLQARVPLPPGYTYRLGGEAENAQRSFGGLGPAIVVATLGILAVLVLEFGSLRTVAVVFGVVPLGFFGAVLALWVTGNSLSFTAAVGLIALVGIEIKNSILLVDFTEQLRRDGKGVREAIEQAGELRFLPVLLTSITAIGGLLPLALAGNGLYSPMADAMIGGLITSTLLARIATPVMYLLLAKKDAPTPEPELREAMA
ncbi:MAG: efflux RND transporter permease subunit [Proteobacteria bacterium]|nr:efflux RND transporter permease subunit [Pseudomonadota bacterium]